MLRLAGARALWNSRRYQNRYHRLFFAFEISFQHLHNWNVILYFSSVHALYSIVESVYFFFSSSGYGESSPIWTPRISMAKRVKISQVLLKKISYIIINTNSIQNLPFLKLSHSYKWCLDRG